MDVKPIRTEADYDAALKAIEPYFIDEPALGSPESDRFEVLITLIRAYEQDHWPVLPPDPVSAIQEAMNWMNYSQKDFAILIGSKSRASEILNRKHGLTFEQARLLHEQWHVPAEALLAEAIIGGSA